MKNLLLGQLNDNHLPDNQQPGAVVSDAFVSEYRFSQLFKLLRHGSWTRPALYGLAAITAISVSGLFGYTIYRHNVSDNIQATSSSGASSATTSDNSKNKSTVAAPSTTGATPKPSSTKSNAGVATASGSSTGGSSSNSTGTTPPPPPITSSGCPAYPAFPSTSCTGWQHTGVTLTPYTGPTTITTAGTTIDSKNITDCLYIAANNVTISRSWLRCAGGPESTTTFGIDVANGVTGLVVQDTEIMSTTIPSNCQMGDPPLLTRPMELGGAVNARLTRVYAHNVRTGINVGDGTTIEDSVLATDCNPDPHNGSGQDWQHSTAVNSLGGTKNVTLRHNVFDNGAANASSAMSFYPETAFGGANDSFTIDQNLINSQAYYCAYFGYTPSAGESPNTRFAITNNVWGTKYNPLCGMSAPVVYSNLDITKFNTAYPSGWGNTWSGNIWKNGQAYNLSDI